MALSEEALKLQLEELQKQLAKKQKFEHAVSSIKSLFLEYYPSASHHLRKSFYTVICRVATILKTRYTAPGFWLAGLGLFEQAEILVSDSSEHELLRNCIAQAKEQLNLTQNPPDVSSSSSGGGYLFEGHLTVDPEPPEPLWLRQSNLMQTAASLLEAESVGGSSNSVDTTGNVSTVLEELISNLNDMIPELMIPDNESRVPKVPPASKEVVAKLPVITLTEEILERLGQDAECAICKENLVVYDKMQELPCKHTFHPPCLKPWLDEHNSCPICRHELQTDDHVYESWKEREKEAEEERKGAANSVDRGDFIII